jgi:hypothetical protein
MASFNLFPKPLLCPACFKQFYLGDCDIVSTITQGKVLRSGRGDIFSRIWPEPLNTPNYTKELACRKCPHCGYLLPHNFGQSDNVIIAIVGDVAAGLSTYLAALIHQIKKGRIPGYVRFSALNEDVENQFREWIYEPLFINKQSPPFTQPSLDSVQYPLIYELIIRSESTRKEKCINIILYQKAGEAIVIQSRMVTYGRYILHASAIIFLADPLAMPGIVDRLPPHLQPRWRLGRQPSHVLSGILSVLERYNKDRLHTAPLAVILPKSDLLRHLPQTGQTYTFLHEPTPSQYLDLKDQQTVEHEVKDILEQYGDRPLLSVANAFSHVGFFAVAPTGHPPNENGIFPAVEPIRCLDPLLWILWKLKFIDAR